MAHSHNHNHSHEVTGKNLSVSIFLNIAITLAQIIGGFISGSLSLLSDALHNFSDVLSLILSLFAHKLAKRKASEKYTFGYKRAEILAAFINAATLVIVALFLIYEAVERFSKPEVIGSGLVIWLSLLGILFNGFSALILKKDAEHNLNMKSAYLHLFTDMMASVAVLVGGLLMKYFQWFWIDSVITLGIAIYLIIMGFGLLKSTTKMLMLFTPEDLDINEIIAKLHNVTGKNTLHHIHLWNLNDNKLHFEAHLECTENISISDFNSIVSEIEEVLHHEFHISHCTIQPEFGKSCSKEFIVQD
ncbi:cobalt transporter [Flavobacterium noncentrifugens]|uniref:Cobalt-zinc-cadmium efflux system protein n=1 Tax=Flavobacterium noncentrifugens TaxID=1128970 RepID=A0A1G8T0E2_9FLAO|nr:cation diffusion facilitator family transporter [Flavobacterium noncentrifugens]GEP50015.1 cobalt transporter [Flavobacterium noncentrifugens]SDJ34250.1 cobalt-zinc-cadmium efflux system protein [Flavobacterium noncentrifugens]